MSFRLISSKHNAKPAAPCKSQLNLSFVSDRVGYLLIVMKEIPF